MTNPLIRIRLAQLLARRYSLGSQQAVDLAEQLVVLCHAGNLDIVLSTWVNDVGREKEGRREDFWTRVGKEIETIDIKYGDWHPWKP